MTTFYQHTFNSPAGEMIAIANDEALYLLAFTGRKHFDRGMVKITELADGAIVEGENPIIKSIKQELTAYFSGKLTRFKTPLNTIGTPFQQQVWQQLQNIPHGKTLSYRELAESVGNPKGYRAVARANGANRLTIVIPCHRVINADGGLGGYGGGLERKQWLLELEGVTAAA